MVILELYNGQPVALDTPPVSHQLILGELHFQLKLYLRGHTCKVYSAPFDVHLFEQAGEAPEQVDTVVQPDLMIICDKAKIDERGIHGPPDLIIEILCDATDHRDCVVKLDLYERAGVREYWIVDPEDQTVLVYTLEEGKYHNPRVYNRSDSIRVGVLDDCCIDLDAVFAEDWRNCEVDRKRKHPSGLRRLHGHYAPAKRGAFLACMHDSNRSLSRHAKPLMRTRSALATAKQQRMQRFHISHSGALRLLRASRYCA